MGCDEIMRVFNQFFLSKPIDQGHDRAGADEGYQKHPGALNGEAAGQLFDVIRTYLK